MTNPQRTIKALLCDWSLLSHATRFHYFHLSWLLFCHLADKQTKQKNITSLVIVIIANLISSLQLHKVSEALSAQLLCFCGPHLYCSGSLSQLLLPFF